ncbi:peptidoglycan-binding protein [Streptomyces sp. NPDC014889]|uniref:peptidoglycan-binding domain-containing protein n=1 Tax=Streptomyces sp. NPDC014889 TaxID=3364928 RepID=UPI0036FE7001
MMLTKRVGLVLSALVLGAGSFAVAPAIASPVPTPMAESACPYSGAHPNLYLTDTGPAVKHAQCLLNIYGRRVAEDGIYGSTTQAQVKWAQQACKIPADGIVGPKTWDCLHPDKSPNPNP